MKEVQLCIEAGGTILLSVSFPICRWIYVQDLFLPPFLRSLENNLSFLSFLSFRHHRGSDSDSIPQEPPYTSPKFEEVFVRPCFNSLDLRHTLLDFVKQSWSSPLPLLRTFLLRRGQTQRPCSCDEVRS